MNKNNYEMFFDTLCNKCAMNVKQLLECLTDPNYSWMLFTNI